MVAPLLTEAKGASPLEVLPCEHSGGAGRSVCSLSPLPRWGTTSFARPMHRHAGDAALAASTIDRVVHLMEGWPELNEFTHAAVLR